VGIESTSVFTLSDPQQLQALSHSTRVAILEALREPMSAASVARVLGQPRQRINYHLKELERVALVEPVEERRKGNFIETLYRAVARSFVVSPQIAWSNPRRLEAMQRQHSLGTLVEMGERLQADAAVLLDRAAFDGEQIASAGVTAEVHFASEADRAAFMDAFLRSTRELLEAHGSKDGEPFRAVFAVYPETGAEASPAEGASDGVGTHVRVHSADR
jgi:DNA-binding transcriptional ArsR family regulator